LSKALSRDIIDTGKAGVSSLESKKKEAWIEMPLTILILGDDADARQHLNRLIDSHPAWKVVGTMAYDKALAGSPLQSSPDVVISGLDRLDSSMMPLISSIRDKFGGSKILVASSQQDSRLVLRMIHAGANGYMIMDRAAEELAAAIKMVAAGGTYLSPGIAGLTRKAPQ
jgi:DNA-binding NarL/FixJ family response regulator